MTDMHPYEALKIALQEARDERDDWRESATRAAGESCGDERHCACVGPLRKELRDAKAKLAALVDYLRDEMATSSKAIPSTADEAIGDAERVLFCQQLLEHEALAAAKVQP